MRRIVWLIRCFKLLTILLFVTILTLWVEVVRLLVAIVCFVLPKLLLCESSELLLWHWWSWAKWSARGSSPLRSASSLRLWPWALSILLRTPHRQSRVVSCVGLLTSIRHWVSADAVRSNPVAGLLISRVVCLCQIHVVGPLVAPVAVVVPSIGLLVVVVITVVVAAVGITSIIVVVLPVAVAVVVVLLVIVLLVLSVVRLFLSHCWLYCWRRRDSWALGL